MSNPFFNVERQPLYANVNGKQVKVGREAIINTETEQVVGVVTPRYKTILNSDVNDIFNKAFEKFEVEKSSDHISADGSKWVRDIIFKDDMFAREIVPDDVVKLKVRIWNGYDGKTAVGFNLMGWRQVCSNGMMGWGNMFSTQLKHWGDNNINMIRASFDQKFSRYVTVFDRMTEWSKIPYKQTSFEAFVDNRNKELNKAGYLSDKQAKEIKELWPSIMNKYNETGSVWGSYNVLTAIAEHHTKAKAGSKLFSAGYNRIERLVNDFVSESTK